jgi:hypothetical protein
MRTDFAGQNQQTGSTPGQPSGSMENKRNLMRTLIFHRFRSMISTSLVCLGVAMVLSSCSKKPQEQIVGKWTEPGEPNVLEFRKDGTAITTKPDGTQTAAKYKFLNDTNLQMEVDLKGGTNTLHLQLTFGVAIHGDTADLTLAAPDRDGTTTTGKTMHLNRAK